MSEAPQTLDGWYILHDFRKMDWAAWRELSDDERKAAIDELFTFLDEWEKVKSNREGEFTLLYNRRAKSRLS